MNRLKMINQQKDQRKKRIRAKVVGTPERPRLSIFISNKHITGQIIDDQKQRTLVYASTVGKPKMKGTLTEQAKEVGSELAKKAKSAKIGRVVLDRNGRIYHGRIKALAEAAREGGLEF